MPLIPKSQPRIIFPMPSLNLISPLSKRLPELSSLPSYLTCTTLPSFASSPRPGLSTRNLTPLCDCISISGSMGLSFLACGFAKPKSMDALHWPILSPSVFASFRGPSEADDGRRLPAVSDPAGCEAVTAPTRSSLPPPATLRVNLPLSAV
eukprot:CAMPEP_0197675338 /NCGR_PEP_ID=MMETSP1338-20131121/84766_1 /TAXON_ID=43686 ORGANISM="Pelagodinium beii, Strain RCC1491" /NCGR_SAMPLE_ID=MMETSP1338 /ASSEMBLY_ACC=CAM_ASM_000754 /LENGTH=150 /DNA_ID=CAMNT_0043255873 /DNA_START=68 /DNA_END=517 /DNA_ORIENTATION=+